MAIDKQTAPLDSPASLTDWQRLIDITDTLALSFKNPWPVKVVTGTGYIIRGSVFYIGGAWYKANIDVAITGTETDYIQLTVDNINNLVTAAYVATLTDVSWNDQWNGWYDTAGKFYVFDEALAYGEGLIDFPRTVAYSRPKNAETAKALSTPMGSNWANILKQNCETASPDQVVIGLPNTLYTNYNRTSRRARLHSIVNGWSNVFTIIFNPGTCRGTLNAFRFMWENDDSISDNYVQIMNGDTNIASWNDDTQKDILIDVTGLDIESGITLTVRYHDVSSTGIGTRSMALNVYASCCDDADKPNIIEYVFNAVNNFLSVGAV